MTMRYMHVLAAAALALATTTAGLAVSQVDDETEAMHVLDRLGYGPRPGDLERVMKMGVDRYIAEQLHPEALALPPDLVARLAQMPAMALSEADLVTQFRSAQKRATEGGESDKQMARQLARSLAEQSGAARLLRAVESPRQLQEVMVDFWFNHFNVFEGKGLDRALVANYEREAIRPYALGRFRDLLGSTAHHPAMLFYLDNWLSSAPGFIAPGNTQATRKISGLNENYARELMELHTLGVDGGYQQKDVTELARMLTGWTFDVRGEAGGSTFKFDARRHDWGDKEWLNYHVAPRGQAEGEWALDVLANSPATAHHISALLAQYFVADVPPPALVERLAARFMASHGDIRSVLEVLFSSPEFRNPENFGNKFKTPYQYVISAARAGAVPLPDASVFLRALNQLGMPLYNCPTPDGYKNTEEAWLNPDAMTRRIGFATALATGHLPVRSRPEVSAPMKATGMLQETDAPDSQVPAAPLDADALLATLATDISQKTRWTVAAANPPLRAAMILGSPDFMRH